MAPQTSSISARRKLQSLPSLDLAFAKVRPVAQNNGSGEAATDGKTRFDNAFDLGHIVGSGTVSVVRSATRKKDGVQVAVKIVSTEDKEIQQITRDEYELVRSLSHPAVCHFDAFFEAEYRQWICMEYCMNGSLDAYVKREGSFAESEVRSLAVQLMRGVNYLHHKRVIHRDIKPENLLLRKGATVLKITDFNSARRIGQTGGLNLMLTDRGTRQYQAPELRFGLMWNERIDIWNSGICTFFMLSGCFPFEYEDYLVKECLSTGSLPPIDWQGMSQSMKNFVEQCLMVNMYDRPPAMELLLHPVFRLTSDRSDVHNRSLWDSGAQNPSEEHVHDLFCVRPFTGLLAISNGKGACAGAGGIPPRRPSSCFLPSPSVSLESTAPFTLASPPLLPSDGCDATSWKVPSRFDMLLQLAESKYDHMERLAGRTITNVCEF